MKSTTACDDQFIAGEDLAAGDLVIRTPEGVLVKGKLYVKPPAPPAVPVEWRDAVGAALGLLENTTCETGVCMCGDSVIGHADFSVGHSACDSGTYHQSGVIEQLRALLQSAEVRHD